MSARAPSKRGGGTRVENPARLRFLWQKGVHLSGLLWCALAITHDTAVTPDRRGPSLGEKSDGNPNPITYVPQGRYEAKVEADLAM